MPKTIKCVKCGHGSIVRSNFKGLPNGTFYCNSVKRPACLAEWQAEYDYEQSRKAPAYSFNPVRW